MMLAGVDVKSVLRSFHHCHYLPHAMKLVVVGPQSLDELKASVILAADGEWPTASSPLTVCTKFNDTTNKFHIAISL